MATQPLFEALPSVDARVSENVPSSIVSAIPEPPVKLAGREKKIWDHVTQALLEYQLIHLTDGMLLVVICRTFVEWMDANLELDQYKKENNGSYMTETPNGYRQPHPLYYISRDKKKELLQWLPEAALTIPSFAKIKGEKLAADAQASLFDDPVNEFKSGKAKANIRLLKNDGD